MNNEPMPKNCIPLKAAAHTLGMPHKKLLQTMREIGWLHQGKHTHDRLHNTPAKFTIESGWLKTQNRGYPAPYNKNVTVTYTTAVITPEGILQLANELNVTVTPVHYHLVAQPTEILNPESEGRRYCIADEPENLNSNSEAREVALTQMRNMGILDKAG
jgi:hypothetical protein